MLDLEKKTCYTYATSVNLFQLAVVCDFSVVMVQRLSIKMSMFLIFPMITKDKRRVL